MAPDGSSFPPSPRVDRAGPDSRTSLPPSASASRRASQIMGPPPAPNGTGTTSTTTIHGHQVHRSPVISSNEQYGVPLRHPRPLTAAELYLQCEKEQEAVVNRLTRELTALRAQSASVASNASHSSTSTSASLLPIDISDPNPTHQLIGATHPTPSRRHRSSSSLSSRSIPTPMSTTGSTTTNVLTQAHVASIANAPTSGISQASAERAAAATGVQPTLSRQPSITTSGNSTPARQSLDFNRHTLSNRPPLSRDPSYTNPATQHQSMTSPSNQTTIPHPLPSPVPSPSGTAAAMQHYAETAAYRTEMEIVKAENEALRQRVRALERALRARRRDSSQSDTGSTRQADIANGRASVGGRDGVLVSPVVAAWDGGIGGVAPPRERSESQSTTASSRRGGGAVPGVGGGVVGEEEVVRVGESAHSAGIVRGGA